MACNCFNVIAEKLKTKLVNALNIEPRQITDCGWENESFILGETLRCDVPLQYAVKFKKIRKDGTFFANKTTEIISVHLTFCPFCGKKITDPSDSQ